ncbi:MAG: IS110 family transposase, partial [Bacilli bacterium]
PGILKLLIQRVINQHTNSPFFLNSLVSLQDVIKFVIVNVNLYFFPYCFDFLERILPLLCIVFIISCMSLLNSKHTRLFDTFEVDYISQSQINHFRKEFIIMKLVGIDIAKYKHAAFVMDASTGESLCDPFFFNNNKEGFNELYAELNKYPKDEILIGMEDTGHYNFAIESNLLSEGYKVALINPITTKNLRKASLKTIKSDKKDAILIAKTLLDKDYYRIISIQDDKLNQAKELTRYRTQLTIEMNRKKNTLQRHIDIVFPEFNTLFNNEYTITYLNILREYSDAYTIAHTDIRSLRKCFKYCNSFTAEELKELASNSVGVHNTSISFIIKSIIASIDLINSQIDELDKKIEELAITQDSSITSIPGISTISGTSILAELGDIRKYSNAGKIIKFAGVNPYISESGEFSANKTAITKKGSKYLRITLYRAIIPVIRHNPIFNDYYHLKRSQGKGHLCALGHCVRKLLRIIYHLETNNLKFDINYLK